MLPAPSLRQYFLLLNCLFPFVLVDPSEVNRVFSGRIPQAALCVCSAGGLAQLPLSFLPQNYLPVCK